MAIGMTMDMATATGEDRDAQLQAADIPFNTWAEQNRLGAFENYLAEMARIGEIFEMESVDRTARYGYLAQGTERLSEIRDRFDYLLMAAEPTA